MAQIESAAAAGKIAAVARNHTMDELRYRPATGLWTSRTGGTSLTGASLRSFAAASGQVITITADLPENVTPLGARQPLLSPEGVEAVGQAPPVLRPAAGSTAVVRVVQSYVDPAAQVLIDGEPCAACSISLTTNGSGTPVADITLAPVPPAGAARALQVLNPNGLASNEMPVVPQ